MIANIIIIATIVLFIIIGIKRGIAKTLLNLAGLIFTAITAYYLSSFLAQLIYDNFLKQTIISNLEQIIEQQGIEYAVLNCFDAVPIFITAILSLIFGLFGVSLEEFQKNMSFSKDVSLSLAENIEASLSSTVTTVLAIILIILLFIIILILVKKIIKLALKIFEIPVIKQINKLLGGLLGAVEGIVFLWFAINIFYAIMSFINPVMLDNSFISGDLFNFFCISL